MVKATVTTVKSKESSTMNLPKEFSGDTKNLAILAQAIRVYEYAKHPGTHKVKTRGEVSYSTKKLYRQKHTGRARHGARGAPIYVGGGIAHGPTGIKRELTLPKKMKRKALEIALSLKAGQEKVFVIDGVEKIKKTKEAKTLLDKFGKGNMTVALSDKNARAYLNFRNIKNVRVMPYKNLNAYDIYLGGNLIIDKEALEKNATAKRTKLTPKIQNSKKGK